MNMEFERIISAIAILSAICFGITQKISDASIEHNLHITSSASILSSVLCGVFASYCIFLSPKYAIIIGALLAFWYFKKKIDCINHKISAAIIATAIIYVIYYGYLDIILIAVTFALYFFSDLMKLRPNNILAFGRFFSFQLHLYLVPLLVAIICDDLIVFMVSSSGMMGVQLTRWILNRSYLPLDRGVGGT